MSSESTKYGSERGKRRALRPPRDMSVLETPLSKEISARRRERLQKLVDSADADNKKHKDKLLLDPRSPEAKAIVALRGLSQRVGKQAGAEIFVLADLMRAQAISEKEVDATVAQILSTHTFTTQQDRNSFLRNVDLAKPLLRADTDFDPNERLYGRSSEPVVKDPVFDPNKTVRLVPDADDFAKTVEITPLHDEAAFRDTIDSAEVAAATVSDESLLQHNEGGLSFLEQNFLDTLGEKVASMKTFPDVIAVRNFIQQELPLITEEGSSELIEEKLYDLDKILQFAETEQELQEKLQHYPTSEAFIRTYETENGCTLPSTPGNFRNKLIGVLESLKGDFETRVSLDEEQVKEGDLNPSIKEKRERSHAIILEFVNGIKQAQTIYELRAVLEQSAAKEADIILVEKQFDFASNIAAIDALIEFGKAQDSAYEMWRKSPYLFTDVTSSFLLRERVRELCIKEFADGTEEISNTNPETYSEQSKEAAAPKSFEIVKQFAEMIRDAQTLEDLIGVIQDGEHNGIKALLIDGPLNFVEVAQSLTELQKEQDPKKVEEILSKIPERFSLRFHAKRLKDTPQSGEDVENQEIANSVKTNEILPEVLEIPEQIPTITSEELVRVPEYNKLSPEQQALVLANVREYNDSAPDSYLRHLLAGYVDSQQREGSSHEPIDAKKAIMEVLVKPVYENNVKAHIAPDGTIRPSFVPPDGMSREKGEKYKQKEAIIALNKAAYALAEVPDSWKTDGIGTHAKNESRVMSFFKERFSPSRKRYREFESMQTAYEAAKQKVAQAFREGGVSSAEVAQKLVQVQYLVTQHRFMKNNAEEVAALQNTKDKGFWRNLGGKLFTKENGIYFGVGLLGRIACAGASMTVALPLVAAATASSRAWNRSAAELREKDRLAQLGVVDTSSEALNIVQAVQPIRVGNEVRDRGVVQKTQELIDRLEALEKEADLQVPENYAKYTKTLSQLKARAIYMEDKLKLSRVNFGSKEVQEVNMAKFFQVLTAAKMLVIEREEKGAEGYIGRYGRTIEERLKGVLDIREDRMQNRRRLKQVKNMAWDSVKVIALVEAGKEIADAAKVGAEYIRGTDVYNAVREAVSLQSDDVRSVVEGSQQGVDVSPEQVSEVSTPPAPPEALPFENVQLPASYTVQSNDTLFEILQRTSPDHADMEALRALSPAQLQQVGIESGDINDIKADQTIDLERLRHFIDIQNAEVNPDAPSSNPREARIPGKDLASLDDEGVLEKNSSRVAFEGRESESAGIQFVSNENITEGIDTRKTFFLDGTENVLEKQRAISAALIGPDVTPSKLAEVRLLRVSNIEEILLNESGVTEQQKTLLKRILETRNVLAGNEYRITPLKNETIGSYLNRVTEVLGSNYSNRSLEELQQKLLPTTSGRRLV